MGSTYKGETYSEMLKLEHEDKEKTNPWESEKVVACHSTNRNEQGTCSTFHYCAKDKEFDLSQEHVEVLLYQLHTFFFNPNTNANKLALQKYLLYNPAQSSQLKQNAVKPRDSAIDSWDRGTREKAT